MLQDIGYCKQYGCSVLFMVKDAARSYEAIGLLCSGLFQATSIFEILSEGYKHASHPTFDSSGLLICLLIIIYTYSDVIKLSFCLLILAS